MIQLLEFCIGRMRKEQLYGFLLFVAFVAIGCSGKIRQFTYPLDFNYIERQQLSAAMYRLAFGANRLERLVSGQEAGMWNRQKEIVNELKAMEAAVRSLGAAGTHANHPLLGENRDAFILDLNQAQREAERDPPNYFWAGQIRGSCMSCHQQR